MQYIGIYTYTWESSQKKNYFAIYIQYTCNIHVHVNVYILHICSFTLSDNALHLLCTLYIWSSVIYIYIFVHLNWEINGLCPSYFHVIIDLGHIWLKWFEPPSWPKLTKCVKKILKWHIRLWAITQAFFALDNPSQQIFLC